MERRVPVDQEGYTKSFGLSETEEYLDFWHSFGFVIINNVLDQQAIQDTIQEVWDQIENFDYSANEVTSHKFNANRNDSSTWHNAHFPTSAEGFFGLVVTEGKQAFINRQNPVFYEICKNILKKENLWVSIDRYGIMRPTKGIPVGKLSEVQARTVAEDPTGTLPIKDFPEWKTYLELHWDLNPWIWTKTTEGIDYAWDDDFIQENNGSRNDGEPKIQGFINLVDNKIGDGGFSCVAGFNNEIKSYVERTQDTPYKKLNDREYVFVPVPADDDLQKQVTNISLRAGSALIWSSELPHCNYPNDSNKFRIVQYVKMFSAKEAKKGTVKRKQVVQKMINTHNVPITELGQKLLGLKSWH